MVIRLLLVVTMLKIKTVNVQKLFVLLHQPQIAPSFITGGPMAVGLGLPSQVVDRLEVTIKNLVFFFGHTIWLAGS